MLIRKGEESSSQGEINSWTAVSASSSSYKEEASSEGMEEKSEYKGEDEDFSGKLSFPPLDLDTINADSEMEENGENVGDGFDVGSSVEEDEVAGEGESITSGDEETDIEERNSKICSDLRIDNSLKSRGDTKIPSEEDFQDESEIELISNTKKNPEELTEDETRDVPTSVFVSKKQDVVSDDQSGNISSKESMMITAIDSESDPVTGVIETSDNDELVPWYKRLIISSQSKSVLEKKESKKEFLNDEILMEENYPQDVKVPLNICDSDPSIDHANKKNDIDKEEMIEKNLEVDVKVDSGPIKIHGEEENKSEEENKAEEENKTEEEEDADKESTLEDKDVISKSLPTKLSNESIFQEEKKEALDLIDDVKTIGLISKTKVGDKKRLFYIFTLCILFVTTLFSTAAAIRATGERDEWKEKYHRREEEIAELVHQETDRVANSARELCLETMQELKSSLVKDHEVAIRRAVVKAKKERCGAFSYGSSLGGEEEKENAFVRLVDNCWMNLASSASLGPCGEKAVEQVMDATESVAQGALSVLGSMKKTLDFSSWRDV